MPVPGNYACSDLRRLSSISEQPKSVILVERPTLKAEELYHAFYL